MLELKSSSQLSTKALTKKERRKIVWDAPKFMPFSQLPAAVKEVPFLVHPKQLFGPSYFISALVPS